MKLLLAALRSVRISGDRFPVLVHEPHRVVQPAEKAISIVSPNRSRASSADFHAITAATLAASARMAITAATERTMIRSRRSASSCRSASTVERHARSNPADHLEPRQVESVARVTEVGGERFRIVVGDHRAAGIDALEQRRRKRPVRRP